MPLSRSRRSTFHSPPALRTTLNVGRSRYRRAKSMRDRHRLRQRSSQSIRSTRAKGSEPNAGSSRTMALAMENPGRGSR